MILGALPACFWIGPDDLAARRDRDGDGHPAAAFGGDDCDDDDPDVVTGCDATDATPPPAHSAEVAAHTGSPAHSGPTELDCHDGTDDDGDGYADCTDADCAADPGCAPSLVVNEILAEPDPGSLLQPRESDANCDGVTEPVWKDEFVELVNVGPVPIRLAGGTVSDLDAVRFTFPGLADDLPPGAALVIFGGGTWGPAGGGRPPDHPWCVPPPDGVVFVADGLSLSPSDRLTIRLPDVEVQAEWTSAPSGPSLNRDPDLADTPLVPHNEVTGAEGRFSPLRRTDQSPFGG